MASDTGFFLERQQRIDEVPPRPQRAWCLTVVRLECRPARPKTHASGSPIHPWRYSHRWVYRRTIRGPRSRHASRYRLRHMLIGDARVSKADGSQSLDLQRAALRADGVDAVTATSITTSRPVQALAS